MTIAPGSYTLKVSAVDSSKEPTSVSVPLGRDMNIRDSTDTDQVAFAAFIASIDNICTLTTVGFDVVTKLNQPPLAVGEGNREDKWLVGYHDSVTFKPYTFTLPCRKYNLTMAGDTDFLDLTVVGVATFVSAAEAFIKRDGNAIVIDYIRLVGRNL